MATAGQDAGSRGGLEDVLLRFDCFQERRQRMAGDAGASDDRRGARFATYRFNRGRQIVRREEGRSLGPEGGRRNSLPGRCRRIPVAEFTELRREICAAWRHNPEREKGKNGEGDVGVL
jgi:hypothetical protein